MVVCCYRFHLTLKTIVELKPAFMTYGAIVTCIYYVFAIVGTLNNRRERGGRKKQSDRERRECDTKTETERVQKIVSRVLHESV